MKVDRNVMINKAGGTSGKNTVGYKLSLPAAMVKGMGVTKEDRAVILEWNEEEKTIKIYKKEK